MGMVESYVSSYHCVGSLSYKPHNGRDVVLSGFGGGGACKGVWEAWRGWEGGVPAEKQSGGKDSSACLGNQENRGPKSLLSSTVLLPAFPHSMCVLKNTEKKKSFV